MRRDCRGVDDQGVAHNLNLKPRLEEERFTDNSQAIAASVVGAVVGGIAGYLLFTDHGRWLRRQLEPTIEDLGRELNSFRATIEKAAGVASEGWKLLNE